MAKLGEICSVITDGSHYSPADVGEGYPMMSVKDMGDDDFSFDSCKYISEIDYNDLLKNGCRPEVGDVLLAKDGSYFRYAFVVKENRELAVLSSIAILRPKKEVIDASYLREFLMADSTYRIVSLNYISGTALKRVILQGIKKIEVPVPPLNEQKRIANKFNTIDRLIFLRKQQLAKLDELVKARFVELFGNVRDNEKNWEKVSLKSVAEVRGRVGWKGYKKDDLRESGPLVLGATHLTESGCIDLSSPVYLSREKYEESPEIMLQKNDLIFTQRGNTIGKVGLLENDIGEATINPCVLILRPLTINPVYFKTYFVLDETKSDMWSLNAGSAQPMITQKGIGEYMLMLPPLELQEQFATFVEQTDKSKLTVQQSLDKLEVLKKSLMQQYFG